MALQNSAGGPAPAPAASLWSNPGFGWLWGSGSLESLGDSTLRTVIPIIAVSVLGAGTASVGVLNALSLAAFLLIGIPAGALVDRWRKRRVLVVASTARALAVLGIPVAFLCDALNLGVLLCVVAAAGIADVFFTTAYSALLPSVVGADQIAPATAQVQAAQSVIGLAGPALAGGLLKLLGAPLTVLASSLSYLVSALMMGRVTSEPSGAPSTGRGGLWAEARQGFLYCVRHRVLRSMMLSTMLLNAGAMFGNAATAVFALTRLDIAPSAFALLGTFAAAGGLLGSLLAPLLLRRWGLGRTKITASALSLPVVGLYPLAGMLPLSPLLWLGASGFGWAMLVVIHTVAGADVIPKLTDAPMLGRVVASNRFFVLGSMPVASLAGGLVAAGSGPATALWIWAVLAALSAVPIVFSPIRRWREVPVSSLAD